MSFNPLSSNGGFSTQRYVLPIADYTFTVTGVGIRKQPMQGENKIIIDVNARVSKGPAEAMGKATSVQCIVGTLSESTGEFTTDEEGNPIVDMRQLAQVFHACLGYGMTKEEDERFAAEQDGLDLTIDEKELKLPGQGFEDLKGHSFDATIQHNYNKGNTYLKFKDIRMVD
jgi:hypothetical protein